MKRLTKIFEAGGLSLVLAIMLTVLIAGCGQKVDAPATSGDAPTQQEKNGTKDATGTSADSDAKTQDSKEYTLEDIDGWWKMTHSVRSDGLWDFEGSALDEYNQEYEITNAFGIDSKSQTYMIDAVGIYMEGTITPSEENPNEFVLVSSSADGIGRYFKDGKATCTVEDGSIVINADVNWTGEESISVQMEFVPYGENENIKTGSLTDTMDALINDAHDKQLARYAYLDHSDREIIVATEGSREVTPTVYFENKVTMTLLSVAETDDSIVLIMDCGAVKTPDDVGFIVNRYIAEPLILNGSIEIENNISCLVASNDSESMNDPDVTWRARYCALTIPKSVVGSVSEIQSITGKVEITGIDWSPVETIDFEVTAADLQ